MGAASLILLVLLGCNLTRANPAPGDIDPVWAAPSPTPTLTPSPSPVPDSGDWQVIAPGIELRDIDLSVGSLAPRAIVLRLDPAAVVLRVHYSPGDSRDLGAWRASLPDAAVIVNAGFFDEQDRALGLLVTGGQVYGQSFAGFGGMFQVALDGTVRVRSLVSEPYWGETLNEVVQSFPMLVEPGGTLAAQGDGFDQRSRRTVIAQDFDGRILLAVVPYGMVSFAELQHWLLDSDLDVQIAVALDGGRSTGLDVLAGNVAEQYPSFSPVPAVIAVYVP